MNTPRDGFRFGTDTQTWFAYVETYEAWPPWGKHDWQQSCDEAAEATLTLAPAYSDHDCQEALRLLTPSLTETCCKGEGCFEEHLSEGIGPKSCGIDCTHTFFSYSQECAAFLAKNHPGLAGFTKQCADTHRTMTVIDLDGLLAAAGHGDHSRGR